MGRLFNPKNYLIFFYIITILFFVISLFLALKVFSTSIVLMTPTTEEYKYHVVLLAEEEDHEYWTLIENGAKDTAIQYEILIENMAPKLADSVDHIDKFEMAIASKVDGIITPVLSHPRFDTLVNEAKNRDIPVVTIDSEHQNNKSLPYIGSNNYSVGLLAGQALIDDTDGKANVGIILSNTQSINQQLRLKGLMEKLEEVEGITVISIAESLNSRVGATKVAYEMLNRHPKITALVGLSYVDGLGIAQVVEPRLDVLAKMYILTFDLFPDTLDMLDRGIIHAIITQEPYEMGVQAVETILPLLEGEGIETFHYIENKVLRKGDITSVNTKDWIELR